jgi:hypothetical protein
MNCWRSVIGLFGVLALTTWDHQRRNKRREVTREERGRFMEQRKDVRREVMEERRKDKDEEKRG